MAKALGKHPQLIAWQIDNGWAAISPSFPSTKKRGATGTLG